MRINLITHSLNIPNSKIKCLYIAYKDYKKNDKYFDFLSTNFSLWVKIKTNIFKGINNFKI